MIYPVYRDMRSGDRVAALGYDILIHTRRIGALKLPTGRLVACDPIVHPTSEPFELEIKPGEYTVQLVIAELRDEQRVAYAVLRLKPESARSWEVATVESEDTSLLSRDERGYTVVSSLASFMDAATADLYLSYLELHHDEEPSDLEKSLQTLERRALKRGVSFGNLTHEWLAGGNILTCSSGFGEGFYQTYVGRDESGEISRVVTDFRVLDLRFPSFKF